MRIQPALHLVPWTRSKKSGGRDVRTLELRLLEVRIFIDAKKVGSENGATHRVRKGGEGPHIPERRGSGRVELRRSATCGSASTTIMMLRNS